MTISFKQEDKVIAQTYMTTMVTTNKNLQQIQKKEKEIQTQH